MLRPPASASSERRGYLRQGRIYETFSDAELAAPWITAIRAWAAAPAKRSPTIDDEGEFALRGRDPPCAVARDVIGGLAARAMAGVAGMTAAERCAAGERNLSRYGGERAQNN